MNPVASIKPAPAPPGRVVASVFVASVLVATPLFASPDSPTPAPASPTPAPNASVSPADIPYGLPVPDKPGFLRSPYSTDAGIVDVRAFKSGDVVRDPFTRKLFRVP